MKSLEGLSGWSNGGQTARKYHTPICNSSKFRETFRKVWGKVLHIVAREAPRGQYLLCRVWMLALFGPCQTTSGRLESGNKEVGKEICPCHPNSACIVSISRRWVPPVAWVILWLTFKIWTRTALIMGRNKMSEFLTRIALAMITRGGFPHKVIGQDDWRRLCWNSIG